MSIIQSAETMNVSERSTNTPAIRPTNRLGSAVAINLVERSVDVRAYRRDCLWARWAGE
jgi:hypothetical protein